LSEPIEEIDALPERIAKALTSTKERPPKPKKQK
jgi:hypothetical protein